MRYKHYFIPIVLDETVLTYEVVGELSLHEVEQSLLNLSDVYKAPSNEKIAAYYDYAVKYLAKPTNFKVRKYGVLAHNQYIFTFGVIIDFVYEDTGEIFTSYLIKETPKNVKVYHLV